ncbi:MAG: hypothetical protein V8S74_10885 [Lachnospirales bacterium]
MGNFELNKKIISGLIIGWCIFLIINWIPEALSFGKNIISFKNIINEDYTSYIPEQSFIYYLMIKYITNIFFLLLICMFSVTILFYKNYTIQLGLAISMQTMFNTLLLIWDKYLIISYKEKPIIDLKIWVILSISIIFIICFFIIKEKWFNSFFIVATMIQFINTCFLVKQYINNLSYFWVLFGCFYELIIYVLYWTLLIFNRYSKRVKIN